MKRFFLLLVFLNTYAHLYAQAGGSGNGPGVYMWAGDQNWTVLGPSAHNNQGDGPSGVPYGLQVDVTTSGTLKYAFTAGIGGGYRGDQIIFWVKRPVFWAIVTYREPMSSTLSTLEAPFDTPEEANAWITKEQAILRLRLASLGASRVQKNDWRILSIVGTPHGVPTASEVSNDFAQRGWTYSNQSFAYDPVVNGGLEIRASFWTFQRTAGDSQKLTMQDRGPWTLALVNPVPTSVGGKAALWVVPDPPGTLHPHSWADSSVAGGFTAYLARGVKMRGTATAEISEAIGTVEFQAFSPNDTDWKTIESKTYGTASTTDDSFSFSIDAARGGPTDPKGLIPRDLTLAALSPGGKFWRYRLHVVMQSGHQVYSPDLPLRVLLPFIVKSLNAQTLPPAGPESKWYNPSDVKSFTVNLLIP